MDRSWLGPHGAFPRQCLLAKVWLDKRFLLVLCFVCGRASLGIDRTDRKGEGEGETEGEGRSERGRERGKERRGES